MIYPFSDGDTHATFRRLIETVTAEIASLDSNYVLNASPTELEQYYLDRVLINPLVLRADQRYIDSQTPTPIDVSNDFRRGYYRGTIPGTTVTIAIPYEGDPQLWRISASTYSVSGYPEIDIQKDRILFSISFPNDTAAAEQLRDQIERKTKSLADAVAHLKRDVDNHNNSAPSTIRQALEQKRAQAQSVTGAVASLGIPMRRAAQPTFTIPAQRRQTPVRPSVPQGQYEPEPVLDEKEYQHILDVLRSMSLVIERNPATFASLDEEAIRDHFLLQLNGQYEGGATGETFNAAGKTDILIRHGNRNVFIAECKFWRGPKSFDDAIDQILGYLTWRDTKCALLIFNRTKDTSAVREKMHEAMQARPEHRKTVLHTPNADSRYILVKTADPGREIIVTTQLYDVPEATSS